MSSGSSNGPIATGDEQGVRPGAEYCLVSIHQEADSDTTKFNELPRDTIGRMFKPPVDYKEDRLLHVPIYVKGRLL